MNNYVEISDYERIFEKDLSVYGNVLRIFTSKLSDIPQQLSSNVLEIGQLYGDIKYLSMMMFHLYVDLSMLSKNFFTEEFLDPRIPLDHSKENYKEFLFSESGLDEYAFPEVKQGPQFLVQRYKEPEGKKTIVVIFLYENPIVVESGIFYQFKTFEDENKQDMLDKIDEEVNKQKNMDASIHVVPSPILFRLFPDEIKKFSREISKNPGVELASVDKLLSKFCLRTEEFTKEWEKVMNIVMKYLRMKYPFLSALERNTTLREAYSELREAESIMGKSEHTNEDLKTIIHKATLAAESFLSILYEIFLGERAGEKGFSSLLDSLVDKIQESFGEDEVSDLRRLAFFRNEVNHPKDHQFTLADSIKVLRWSQAFADLFSSQKFS